MRKHVESAATQSTLTALLLILVVYFALATLFAVTTPPWQNPDEPAHYNYIAFLVNEGHLPLLQMGDYDGAHLEQLKGAKFASDLSIATLRYEFHQPPLYYLLAAPLYWLTGGDLLALRLFSVALGGGIVLLVFACARTVLPDSPFIALGSAAFAAFLPMHLALMASVNNDAVAELVIAAAMLALLRWQRLHDTGQAGSRHLIAISVLIGLGFLTKATTYILLPVALIVVAAASVRGRAGRPLPAKAQLKRFATLLTPALFLGLPLWVRNSLVYGDLDFLGLAWHDAVVTGQPTTAAWIAENGWSAYWERAWTSTSESFWGVFGWLGVFMDGRIYTALFILSVMAAVGVVFLRLAVVRSGRGSLFSLSSPWIALLLLWLATFAAYVWYNAGFIQHQGRYLFPALPTWSLLFALGWWAVLERRASIAAGGLLLAAAGGMAALRFLLDGSMAGSFDNWTLLLFGLAGGGLLLLGLLAGRIPWPSVRVGSPEAKRSGGAAVPSAADGAILRAILYGCLFLALVALDIAIPFLYIIPQLNA